MNPSNETDRQLQIEISEEEDVIVVVLAGSAGMEEADRLRGRLLQVADRKPRVLVIDMSTLRFICSVGLGGMVASCLRCWRHHGVVRLVRPKPEIHNMLVKTKLTAMFEIYDSREKAVTANN